MYVDRKIKSVRVTGNEHFHEMNVVMAAKMQGEKSNIYSAVHSTRKKKKDLEQNI